MPSDEITSSIDHSLSYRIILYERSKPREYIQESNCVKAMIVTEFSRDKSGNPMRTFVMYLEEHELRHFLREKVVEYSDGLVKKDDWRLTTSFFNKIIAVELLIWKPGDVKYLTLDSPKQGEIEELLWRPSEFYAREILYEEEVVSLDEFMIMGPDFELKFKKEQFVDAKVFDIMCEMARSVPHPKEGTSWSSDNWYLYHLGDNLIGKNYFECDKKITDYFPNFMTDKITMTADYHFRGDESDSD